MISLKKMKCLCLKRNYDAELYACTHRFGEKMNVESLRNAMTDASFLNQITKQRTEAGRKGGKGGSRGKKLFLGLTASDQTTLAFTHNEELAKRGEKWIERMSGIFY